MAETEASQDSEKPDVVVRSQQWYRESRDHSSEWRSASREWYAMVAGDQWDESDLMTLRDQQRPAVVFNRILRTINAVIGTQVANRQETRFLPRELGDVRPNEVLTSASEWVRDNCDAEDEESDAFSDTCIVGMGWTETLLSYEKDPDGDILIERIDPLEMYWDPASRKRNLSDARWMMHVKPMGIGEFKERWPDADADLAQAPWEGDQDETSQRTHVYPQDAYRYNQANKRGGKGGPQIRVAHVQWAERKSVYRVGKKAERLEEEKYRKIEAKLKEKGIESMRQPGIRWKRAFVAGGQVLEEGDCPFPDGSTFRCMTYARDRNKGTWFGLVKAMVDPQRFGNKFFSQILDIMNKGAKGGIMAENDAVEDFRELEAKWARPDSVIKLRSGAISGNKIKEKPLVKLPAGMENLMSFSLEAVHEVTGINLELLGMANRDQPGVLENQRKQAGLTILAPLFDSMRRYRKEQGRVLLHFIQEYISDGRLIRIIGNDGGEQYVPLARQADTAKYDVIVDESPTSPNMKERVYGALVEMLPGLAKMGVPLPPELLDYAPIPSGLAAKWKEQIQQGQQIPPELQQQMQKLQEENQALKSKREEAMAKLQMDQQVQEGKAGLEQQAAQFDQQKQATEMDMERAKLEAAMELERQKADLQLALEQQKIAADRQRVEAEIALKRWQAEQEVLLQEQKAEAEMVIKAMQAQAASQAQGGGKANGKDGAEKIRAVFRKVTVQRDKNGLMTGADIRDSVN